MCSPLNKKGRVRDCLAKLTEGEDIVNLLMLIPTLGREMGVGPHSRPLCSQCRARDCLPDLESIPQLLTIGGRGLLFRGQWDRLYVTRIETEKNKQFMNKSLRETADQVHRDPLDVLLDLAVEEKTALGVTVSLINSDPEAVGKLLTLPNVLVGLSDAGAHVDQHCEAGVPIEVSGRYKEKGLQAAHKNLNLS